MHATRTSGSEVHSPKRCTWLIFQLRGCSFHFLFPLWIHFLFFSLPGTSGTVHRRERRSFYCLQLYKLSQRQLQVTLAILAALTGAVNSRRAQFFALNRIFFPTNEKDLLKNNNHPDFKPCLR